MDLGFNDLVFGHFPGLGLNDNTEENDYARIYKSQFTWKETRTEEEFLELLREDNFEAIDYEAPRTENQQRNESNPSGAPSPKETGESFSERAAKALKRNRKCRGLRITKCKLNSSKLYPLVNSIHINNVQILYLDLSRNHIGKTGADYVAKLLKKNRVITFLALSQNRIPDKGGRKIAEALAENFSLTYLSLRSNHLGDDTAKSLATTLSAPRRQCLLHLDVSRNKINVKGIEKLHEGILNNHLIQHLRVRNNPGASLKFTKKIDELLHRNCKEQNKDAARVKEFMDSNLKGYWHYSKLMILGKGKAGKTATARSLVNKSFKEKWDSTIGATIYEVVVDMTNESSMKDWRITHKDVDHAVLMAIQGLQDEKRTPLKVATKVSNVVSRLFKPKDLKSINTKSIMPFKSFKLTRTNSESSKEPLPSEVGQSLSPMDVYQSSFGQNLSLQRASIGSSDDEGEIIGDFHESYEAEYGSSRSLTDQTSEVLDGKKNVQYMATSSNGYIPSLSFSVWDYGGQKVFNTLQHLFFTKQGVYLVVFNMREMIKDTKLHVELKELVFWLKSVKLHAPDASVILVGTALDGLPSQDLDSKLAQINEHLNSVLQTIDITIIANDEMVFFPISNSENVGIDSLRSKILITALSQPFMQVKVPIAWMRLLDQLLAIPEFYVTYKTAVSMAKENGINKEKELQELLITANELGIITYLPQTEILKERVITNPQWIVNMISKLIRDKTVHRYDIEKAKKSGLEADFKLLKSKGLASRDLLEFLWKRENAEFLLDLMKQSFLISTWAFDAEELYLVPSLVPSDERMHSSVVWKDRIQDDMSISLSFSKGEMITNTCVFDFSSSFLTDGIFERLVCLIANYAGTVNGASPPEISPHAAKCYTSEQSYFAIEQIEDIIALQCTSNHGYCFGLIDRMLGNIRDNLAGLQILWSVRIIHPKGEISHIEAKESALDPWFARADAQMGIEDLTLETFS